MKLQKRMDDGNTKKKVNGERENERTNKEGNKEKNERKEVK